MKHKHAELIKAWADGAEIQIKNNSTGWEDMDCTPSWADGFEYRIKPEPKPDVVEDTDLWRTNGYDMTEVGRFRLTFDGETGKLKSAEVL
jgi:hypothetical protein